SGSAECGITTATPPAPSMTSRMRWSTFAMIGSCSSSVSAMRGRRDIGGELSGGLLRLDDLRELARFVQLHRDVATADELSVDEELRDRRPAGAARGARAGAGDAG